MSQRGPWRRSSEVRDARIRELYGRGLTKTKIKERLGVSYTTVEAALRAPPKAPIDA